MKNNTHHKINAPDPIEAIKFRMEQEGLKQKDIVIPFPIKNQRIGTEIAI